MGFRLRFILICTTLSLPSVTSISIDVTPPSLKLTLGQNLTILCQDTVTGTNNNLLKLGLYKEVTVGTQTEFQSVVEYGVSFPAGVYTPVWGTYAGDLQRRLEITPTFIDTSYQSGSLEFLLPDVKCEDAAAFLCKGTAAQGQPADSQIRNISVVGVSRLTDLSGAQECDSFVDQETCDNCFDFEDPTNGPKPKFASMNQELMLHCIGIVDSSITTNALRWYKKTKDDFDQQPIIENITDNSNPPRAGSCTYLGRSTLKYYPTSNDKKLQIFCEVGTIQQFTDSRSISICVEGLTVASPIGTIPDTPDPNQTKSIINIGAAVGGGIAALIAVAISVIFAIMLFRKYRTKPADATRHPEGQVAQSQNGREEGGVYQDLSISPDYENNTDTQPYAALGEKASGQCGVPVEVTRHVVRDSVTNTTQNDDQYIYPEDKKEYMEVCDPNFKNTDYENSKPSTNYYNM